MQLGGPGTPRVQDLPLSELAIARGCSEWVVRSLTADGLDLVYRLPATLAALRDGAGEVWVARRVARITRPLSVEQAAAVDMKTAKVLGTESPARILAIAEAAVLAADTDAAREARAGRLRQRTFNVGRLDEQGLRNIFARIEAGDAELLAAMVDRIADALADRPDLTADLAPDSTREELRAEAFGWLAHPDDVRTLLAGTYPVLEENDDEPDSGSDEPTEAAAEPSVRQEAVLYVHHTPGSPVGRVEGIGPVTVEEIIAWLRHTHVTVKPVIDLNTQRTVNGYEHPPDVKERTMVRTGGDVFPHSNTPITPQSRRVDHDHPTPYDEHGPPGQTGDHSDAPLRRRHHRAKTHEGYQVTQLDLGVYLWRTPHGLWRLVDRDGTQRIERD